MPFFCDSWAFQAQDLLTAVQRQQPHAVLASFRRFVEHVEQADVADVDATLNALVKSRRQVEAMLIFMEKNTKSRNNRGFMGVLSPMLGKHGGPIGCSCFLWDLQAARSNLGLNMDK